MLSFLLSRFTDKSLISIDWSDRFLRLIVSQRESNSLEVDIVDCEPLSTGVVENHQIIDFAVMAESLLTLLARNKIKHKKVAFIVSDLNVISKKIQVEKGLSDEEIEVQIELDFNQYIAHPVEETFFDFKILPNQTDKADTQNVLLVAAHQSQVEQYQQLAKICHLSLEIIDIESNVLQRYCDFLPSPVENEFYAMACLNYEGFSLHVIDQSETYLADYKMINPLLSNEEYLHNLSTWLKRNFQVVEVSNSNIKVNRLYVYGDRASDDEIVKKIEALADIKVSVMDLFTLINQPRLTQAVENGPRYIMTAGLAIR